MDEKNDVIYPDNKTFNIGDKKLTLYPLSLGRISKLFNLISGVLKTGSELKDVSEVGILLFPKINEFVKILFYEELTDEWILNNVTMPHLIEFWETIIRQNRLEKILVTFQKLNLIRTVKTEP